jgi:hypothetical protein
LIFFYFYIFHLATFFSYISFTIPTNSPSKAKILLNKDKFTIFKLHIGNVRRQETVVNERKNNIQKVRFEYFHVLEWMIVEITKQRAQIEITNTVRYSGIDSSALFTTTPNITAMYAIKEEIINTVGEITLELFFLFETM